MNKPKSPNRGLGRGLSSLMSDVNQTHDAPADRALKSEQSLPIDQIYPNPDQPRRTFNEEALSDLTASIAEKGIIQPLIVRKRESENGSYEIVAGERRWRAAQRAKLHEVPVIVRNFNDVEVLEVAIIENIQRSDLNAIDEAAGYKQLMEKFGRTQDEMGKALGKSRSHIANSVRLLTLPNSVQAFLEDGRLSAGHARALVGHPDADELAAEIVKKGLSVRDAEKLSKKAKSKPTKPARGKSVPKDADTVQIENELAANLGMKVSISHADGKENGQIVLNYRNLEQLDDLLRLLSGG
ncbi:ParB/RepB/Spo0J family partition protein [Octadecabacter sp. 1_MG-2023]|uniref:ParB/RepB/Spo0J family partition protein n=1 Tax=unclassified Octadecabacter TaxID=196158 RepID=UPI001C085EC8|nr:MULTISPECIES: ParB/RepB/Spo0J family partition protein [unclassified Octadecabacter]MBU2992308.1 ParB/RepB/Spo0J family partition protein [Octadecabacter sp. B2R22]MDO6734935.1 ParB/RepB/Spo0J family partition protein [Octadecabacter sp. 1_MG-2023]